MRVLTVNCVSPFNFKLAKMNPAVHGLEGHIIEANTFYQDEHRLEDGRGLFGNVDFALANRREQGQEGLQRQLPQRALPAGPVQHIRASGALQSPPPGACLGRATHDAHE